MAASHHGVGIILSQGGCQILYLNKALSPKNHSLSSNEKEFQAILLVVDH
jgi:hypothetical protein